MTNKERYKILCEQEGDKIPIFLQYWWMEIVCQGKQWDVVLVEKNNTIVAALPYLIGTRFGMRYVLQPQLTQYNGIWYREQEYATENKRLEFEKWAATAVIEQLEKLNLAYYDQNFSPQITNWLPFYWKGFEQTTRYTYRINDFSDMQKVFDDFDRNFRQKPLLKVENSFSVDWNILPTEFYNLHKAYWQSRGQQDLISEQLAINVCSRALERKQGFIAGLRDDKGELIVAKFIIYDSNCAHSLMSAFKPGRHPKGALPLLFWEIFKYISDKTKSFDFEGSMDEGIEYSYRLYGAKQTPYFKITKANSKLFLLLKTIKERM